MSVRERLTLAVALAVAMGSTAVVPVYSDHHWYLRAFGAIAAVAAVGFAVRRAGTPRILEPVATSLTLLLYICEVFARRSLTFGVLPTRRTVTALNALLQAGLTDIDRLAPPVPSNTGLAMIAVAGVGGVAVTVDLIAVVLGRAAPAGLPLLVLFAVPSAILPRGLGWFPFVCVGAGWLCLLLVEGADRIHRWGGPTPTTVSAYGDGSLGRVGRRIGAAALGVALVVPALIPGLGTRLAAGGGGGSGIATSAGTTTTYNPITKLRDDLRLSSPRQVLTYATDAAAPDYLRLTTLDRFSDAGWSSSNLTADPRQDGVNHPLPTPLGLTFADRLRVTTSIRITDLDARWLPAPAVPARVKVDGPWLYDRNSETVFAIRTSTRALKRSYSVTSTVVVPSAAELGGGLDVGVPQQLQSRYGQDPGDQVTPFVRALTDKVVAGKGTAYARVEAVQAFFTDPKQGFRYNESTSVPGISSASDLEAFLRGRQGFCEQYASAMAAMIRIAHVPARVAVGFTAGTRQDNGSYRVTTRDAHAWPEAWFAGTGWVRFEPTPRSDGQTTVPSYAQTTGASSVPGLGTGPVPSAPSPSPAPVASKGKSALDKFDQASATATARKKAAASGRDRLSLALLGLGVVLVALLPRLTHVLLRRRRWQQAGPLGGWQQVCADAVDLGHRWRPADSPRAAAAHLAQRSELDETARAALGRLAMAAEQARYARAAAPTDPGAARDAATVRAALAAGRSRAFRCRSWLLPSSTWGQITERIRAASARAGEVVEAVVLRARRRLSRRLRTT